MKIGTLLLAALVQLTVFLGISAANAFSLDGKMSCREIESKLRVLKSGILEEISKKNWKLDQLVNEYTDTDESRCFILAFSEYVKAIVEENNLTMSCPTALISSSYVENKCSRNKNKESLNCIAERAKNIEKIIQSELRKISSCSTNLGDSKIARKIYAERPSWEFDFKIMDQIEALQREFSE